MCRPTAFLPLILHFPTPVLQIAMRVSYSESYFVPLPAGHPFPMAKFPALHELLLQEGLLRPDQVICPRPAAWSDLLRVHTSRYLSALAAGTLSQRAERRMGLPWSKRLVHRSRLAVQGTINAAMMALEDGIAANLAGGTHHAYPDHGEGFCVLNDVAVAIRMLKQSCWVRRALVIDLDVHQGNGTASIFSDDPDIFTFSMHGAKNYPFDKPPSTLDVPLSDRTADAAYLGALRQHLPDVLKRAQPDLTFYLAGIDVMANDRYGRTALTRAGLHARDRYVLRTLRAVHQPVTLLLSGGYAATPALTADLHAVAHREAHQVYA